MQRRYVMMSKCELKLMKCLGDMNTTVVTTKYCNALRQGDTSGDQNNEPQIAWHKSAERPHEKEPVSQENPDKELNTDEIPQEDDHTGQKEFDGESDSPDSRLEDSVKEPELVEIQPENGAINDDSDGEKKELDSKENEDQSGYVCPKRCPTHARRLVCARCSHGVHRTFLSPCFMRMYQCKHPNERLELVSRRACTASAPYLGEMPRPSSKVDEPQSDDIVLNHIYGLPNV